MSGYEQMQFPGMDAEVGLWNNKTLDANAMQVELYSDGSAKGNPGPGGYGTVLRYTDPKGQIHMREFSAGYVMTTNNRMELLGAISGFEALTRPCKVTFCSDSKYVLDSFMQNWINSWIKNGWRKSDKKPVKNIDLWKRLLKAIEPHEVHFIWIKGHNGHPFNERCDSLATTAADGDNLLVDEGNEE